MLFTPKTWVDGTSVMNATEAARMDQGIDAAGQRPLRFTDRDAWYPAPPSNGQDVNVAGYTGWIIPFNTGGGFLFKSATFNVTTALAAATCCVGIYEPTDVRWPNPNLLQDFGSASVAATGIVTLTLGTPYTTYLEWVWVHISCSAATTNGITCNIRGANYATSNPAFYMPELMPSQSNAQGADRNCAIGVKGFGGPGTPYTPGTNPNPWNGGSADLFDVLDSSPRVVFSGRGVRG